ncbi:endolytic transglycosylase MltG [Microlunatus elymi]|uniref:Endolytic murein transglycosylase n=1 Tax=Microlunatus elymi TaxID=2596828 RepID=A0A516PZY4_9ACTN|nr:endolytic transglycosylase MltG [Microlunatus elymi]QDP96734.1 endolytic transglycosylase MltG [Microlunatus elymi]
MTSLLDQEPEKRSASAARRGKGCLAVLVALAILVGGGYLGWHKLSGVVENALSTPDYTTKQGVANVTVTVPEGASLTSIGQELVEADVVKSTKAFSKAIQKYDGQPTVQAGSYKMRTQLPATVALTRLTTPQKYRIRNQIQILEGLRLSEQVAVLAKETKIPAKQYQAALKKPGDLGLPTWAKNRPEGFLFPDSYELTDNATATSVLQQMTERFNQVSAEIDLPGRASALHLTPYQVVIVASLIEAEVNRPADRPKAARVIYNRLAKGMPLQLDSTVHYAIGRRGKVTTTAQERASKSPYNTYVHKGLPPGPIGAPGKAALEAAANPAAGSWLYWVAINPQTGETVFTNTKAEHDAAVLRFQQWCQAHKGKC